jgi:Diacylglycerol kinase catalytic domain
VNPRLAAITSLGLLAASVVLAVVLGVQSFPRGLSVLACLVAALWAAWWALVHRGAGRFAAATGAGVLLVGAVVLVVLEGRVLEDALILAALALSVAAARRVFTVHATLLDVAPPKRAVLFYNPKSGGGKAKRFEVAREARARGVEPVELHLGDDLAKLVHDAIAKGADAVGVAGGDGTQAIVAAIAAEHGLPYVCVPAGTRNHFALDLGVDRDDVVGALDAFTNGRERVVDWPRSTAAYSSTTCPSVSTPKPSNARDTGTPSSERSPRRCRPFLVPMVTRSTCALPAPTAASTRRPRSCSSPTTRTGSAALSPPAPDRGWTPECSVSRWPVNTRPAARESVSRSGPYRRFRCAPTGRSQRGSTAKR